MGRAACSSKQGCWFSSPKNQSGATEVGFYPLAFVAALNVDKFVQKIEGSAHAVWGIEKSRTENSTDRRQGRAPGNVGTGAWGDAGGVHLSNT